MFLPALSLVLELQGLVVDVDSRMKRRYIPKIEKSEMKLYSTFREITLGVDEPDARPEIGCAA